MTIGRKLGLAAAISVIAFGVSIADARRFDWRLIPRGPVPPLYDPRIEGLLPTHVEFLDAADRGDLPTVKQHVDKPGFVDLRDAEGRTALMRAAHHGHASVVMVLVRKNPTGIDERDEAGNTALDWADIGKEEGWVTDAVVERLEFLGGERGRPPRARSGSENGGRRDDGDRPPVPVTEGPARPAPSP